MPPRAPGCVQLIAAAVLARRRHSAKGLRWALPRLALLLPATVLLCVPHLVHVLESAAMLRAQDSLPMGRYTTSFIHVSVLDPQLYPALLWPFALLAALPFVSTRPAEGEARRPEAAAPSAKGGPELS